MRKFLIKLTLSFLLVSINIQSQQIGSCKKAKETNRIVSVGGSVTEILYLLNSQNKIIAVDVTSTYPEETKTKKSVGYIRALSSEGILSTQPSLIISEDDIGPRTVVDQIVKSKVDIRIIKEVQNLEGIVDKFICISKIIGKYDKAKKIMETKINPLISQINSKKKKIILKDKKIMLILSMQGTSPVIAGNNTSGHSYIEMIGAKNVYESVNGWKTVTAESIIKMNPDYIILPNKEMHKNSDVKAITENKIFSKTNAGKNKAFIIDDGMAILGFGPRTIDSVLKSIIFIEKSIEE